MQVSSSLPRSPTKSSLRPNITLRTVIVLNDDIHSSNLRTMMCYKKLVVIVLAFNLMVDCAPSTPEIIEWSTYNHFCGSAIPIIMGLICKLPEHISPKPVEVTNHRVRRNIVDDCCNTACTLKYMQSYCHEDLEKISTDKPIVIFKK